MKAPMVFLFEMLFTALLSLTFIGCAIYGHSHANQPESVEAGTSGKGHKKEKKKRKGVPRKKTGEKAKDNQEEKDRTPPPPPPISY